MNIKVAAFTVSEYAPVDMAIAGNIHNTSSCMGDKGSSMKTTMSSELAKIAKDNRCDQPALGLAQMAKDHRWNQYHQDWYRCQRKEDGTNHRTRIGTGAKGPVMELLLYIVPRWQRTIDGTNNSISIGTGGKGPSIKPMISPGFVHVAKDHRSNQ